MVPMDNDTTDDASGGGEPSADAVVDETLIGSVKSLIEDGKTYAEAELAFQKTRLSYVVAHAKIAAILLGIAAVLVVFALFALVFGTLVALMPLLTPMGATIAVTFSLLIVAAVLGVAAKAQFKSLMQAFESRDDEQL